MPELLLPFCADRGVLASRSTQPFHRGRALHVVVPIHSSLVPPTSDPAIPAM
ncbi:hypothetical protein [Arthrobacter sp. TMS1-12-1]